MNIVNQFFTWLLVLMMIISPLRVSMAAEFDQHSHGLNCQMSDKDSHTENDLTMDKDCAMDHDEHCQNHVSCVGTSTSFFQASNQFLFSASKETAIKFTINDENIQAHYPELLKRPPRS